MPGYSLRLPDHPAWWDDPGYSTRTAAILRAVYLDLHAGVGDLSGYYRAYMAVAPLMSRPMCLRQRIRVLYVIGTSYGAVGDFGRAVGAIDLACEVSELLPDYLELIELYAARAGYSKGHRGVRAAAEDYQDCLTFLRVRDEKRTEDSRDQATTQDGLLELDVVTNLGGMRFFLGEYDEAERLLTEARALSWHPGLAHASAYPVVAATVDWLDATLWRARGRPDRALPYAERAAQTYAETPLVASAVRGQLLLVDILLDLADRYPEGTARHARVALAGPHLDLAMDLGREAGDEGGLGMARLAGVRRDRLDGGDQDRSAAIDEVMRQARQRDDDPLLIQAFIALGDELRSRGEFAAARYRYRDVLGLLDGSDTQGLGLAARRALAWESEWRR